MCTVTFIPANDHVFITHNRDEKNARLPAIPPLHSHLKGHKILFPKDKKGGGTWIAINENGNTAVLLNGGFVKHIPASSYRKSRGLVFLEVIGSTDMQREWIAIDLHNIEPFTLILWDNSRLFETRWDGIQKYFTQLNEKESHLWASTTLYDEAALTKRKTWFKAWQRVHPSPSMEDIIDFHLHGGEGDDYNDLRINRDGRMLTVSLTSMQISGDTGIMRYLDFHDDSTHQQEIKFLKATVEK